MAAEREPISVDVGAEIDGAAIGRFHWLIILLCGIVFLFDGFDTQVIAFVAPGIAEAWHVPVTSFGPVFAAGLLGLMIGALTTGPLADRLGRKSMVIATTAVFGLFSLLTPLTTTPTELMIVRVLTGLGLGGAIPNCIALTAEYMPSRVRTMMVTIMACGFSGGGLIGGLVATALVPVLGWQGMFYIGGALPLLHCLLLAALLPESLRFLVQMGAKSALVARSLSRLTSRAFSAASQFYLTEPTPPGMPVAQLFREQRTLRTLLLWLMFFMNFFVTFSLINWLPAVIRQTGAPMKLALAATVLLNLGTLSGVVLSWLADRWGPLWVASVAYIIGAVCVAGIGLADGSIEILLGLCFLAGLFNNGTTFLALVIAAGLYPTAMRTTGLGWSSGMGRIGSMAGPLLAGMMLTAQWSLPQIFGVTAVADIVAGIAAAGLVFAVPKVFRSMATVKL